MDKLLTVKEVADRLRVNDMTVTRYLRDGILKGFKLRRVWRIWESELEKFLKERGASPSKDSR